MVLTYQRSNYILVSTRKIMAKLEMIDSTRSIYVDDHPRLLSQEQEARVKEWYTVILAISGK